MDLEKIFYKNGILNRNKLKENWIKLNFPEIYDIINGDVSLDWINFSQRLYHYLNNLSNYPKCAWCDELNKRWQSFQSGYKPGCSRKCAIQLSRPKSNETRKENTRKKWGVDHTSKLESVKNKMEKTNLVRYGHKAPAMNKLVKQKIKKTNRRKYFVDYPLQNSYIFENLRNKFIQNWGFDNPMKSEIVKEKVKSKNLELYGYESYSSTHEFKSNLSKMFFEKSLKKTPEHIERISVEGDYFNLKCKKCNSESSISRSLFYLRMNRYKTEVCTNCNPLYQKFSSSYEQKLSDFLTSHNVFHKKSYRDKYEIDILIPDMNIGIEINGIYWHSELYKQKNYHFMKSNYFTDRGIKVIQIWEDDWIYKNDIIKSIILRKLNLLENIDSDSCEIIKVSSEIARNFLDKNHLDGYLQSSINYALFYESEIVSVMSLSKIKNGNYEIKRFCNKMNLDVIGSFLKMLTKFKNENQYESIIFHNKCDIPIDENLFEFGFEKEKHTGVQYYWCKGNKRYNKQKIRKDKLLKDGFDNSLSESKIMYSGNFFKCWDSGKYKLSLKRFKV